MNQKTAERIAIALESIAGSLVLIANPKIGVVPSLGSCQVARVDPRANELLPVWNVVHDPALGEKLAAGTSYGIPGG